MKRKTITVDLSCEIEVTVRVRGAVIDDIGALNNAINSLDLGIKELALEDASKIRTYTTSYRRCVSRDYCQNARLNSREERGYFVKELEGAGYVISIDTFEGWDFNVVKCV